MGGVQYEFRIICNKILSGTNPEGVIPVLRKGDKESSVPDPVGNLIYVDMREDAEHDVKFDSLVKAIYSVPRRLKPELGFPPDIATS